VDEWGSYGDLIEVDPDNFKVRGFDDFDGAIAWLKQVYGVSLKAMNEGKPLPFKVIGFDTYTGFDQLAVMKGLQRLGLSDLPKAQSPDGADFYSGLRKDMEHLSHWGRAIRGLGAHWIATAHTMMRETKDSVLADVETGNKLFVPLFRGSFREESPAAFDVVLHSEKRRVGQDLQFALQWKSGSKKMAKSRYGDLADNSYIPNDWSVVRARIDAAAARRRDALKKKLGK
jgi:hypothetical protein